MFSTRKITVSAITTVLISLAATAVAQVECPTGWTWRGSSISKICECFAEGYHDCSVNPGSPNQCYPDGFANPGLTCPPEGSGSEEGGSVADPDECPEGWSIRGTISSRICECFKDGYHDCSLNPGSPNQCYPNGFANPPLSCPPGSDSGDGGNDDGDDDDNGNGGQTPGIEDVEEELIFSIDDTLYALELFADERCSSDVEERNLNRAIRKYQQFLSRAKRLPLSNVARTEIEALNAEARALRADLPQLCK